MQPSTHFSTADELLRKRDDGFRYELVDGRVIRMSPPGSEHGAIAMRIGAALADYVDRHNLGVVFAAETGFQLTVDPDTVRAPDASFVSRERISAGGIPRTYWPGAPDLAVEVLSPDDAAGDVDEKVRQYLQHGVQIVWVVDIGRRSVTVHRPAASSQTLSEADALDGGDILPGFGYSVRRVFEAIRR